VDTGRRIVAKATMGDRSIQNLESQNQRSLRKMGIGASLSSLSINVSMRLLATGPEGAASPQASDGNRTETSSRPTRSSTDWAHSGTAHTTPTDMPLSRQVEHMWCPHGRRTWVAEAWRWFAQGGWRPLLTRRASMLNDWNDGRPSNIPVGWTADQPSS
jgi:hypothetical protein